MCVFRALHVQVAFDKIRNEPMIYDALLAWYIWSERQMFDVNIHCSVNCQAIQMEEINEQLAEAGTSGKSFSFFFQNNTNNFHFIFPFFFFFRKWATNDREKLLQKR